jgi:Icc-related predicted phosphoesterase
MKIVCIADTHSAYDKLVVPAGDMLIHAGDIDAYNQFQELAYFNSWLGRQPHKYKIVIAGNHDGFIAQHYLLVRGVLSNAIYLENSGCEIEGLKIWGSPISPFFNDWFFMAKTREEIQNYWDMIPKDTDILITHSPPSGILDKIYYPKEQHLGCFNLNQKVMKIKPKLHIFGHIHQSYGIKKIGETTFINASIMNEEYNPVNKPIVVEI